MADTSKQRFKNQRDNARDLATRMMSQYLYHREVIGELVEALESATYNNGHTVDHEGSNLAKRVKDWQEESKDYFTHKDIHNL